MRICSVNLYSYIFSLSLLTKASYRIKHAGCQRHLLANVFVLVARAKSKVAHIFASVAYTKHGRAHVESDTVLARAVCIVSCFP